MDEEQKIAALLSDLSRLEKKIGAMAVEAQTLRADLERMTRRPQLYPPAQQWAVAYERRLMRA